MALSENVVDLVVANLQRLPDDLRRGLQVAACLGTQFDADIVDELDFYMNQKTSNFLNQTWGPSAFTAAASLSEEDDVKKVGGKEH
jgi:hypothetical protein